MPRPRKPERKRHRPRGSGSITWCARLERWEARVPRAMGRTASYHATKGAASAWLARTIAAHQERQQLPGADERLGDYLTRWRRRMGTSMAVSRLAQAGHMISKAEPLWPVPLADLRFSHIADWAAGLQRGGLAASTVQVTKQLLGQALSDLVPDVLPTNPAGRPLRLARSSEKSGPTHLEELEAQRLLRVTRGTRGYILWRVMLGTGLRPGEAQGLRWEQIDLESGTAEVGTQWNHLEGALTGTKTRTTRYVELTSSVLTALRELPHREGWLVPGRFAGRPVSRSRMGEWFDEALAAAGLSPELTMHALRHSFASIALSRGVPVTTVSQAIGHSNPAVTMSTYSHAMRQRHGDAERALDEALSEVF